MSNSADVYLDNVKLSPVSGMPKNLEQQPLDDLGAKIAKVKVETGLARAQKSEADDGASFGAAYRLSIDIVVSLAVCTAIGWGLDYIFGWTPWAMLVGLVAGAAAGINNAIRTAMKMDKAADKAAEQAELDKMQAANKKIGSGSETKSDDRSNSADRSLN